MRKTIIRRKDIWMSTKGQYIRGSNILAGNAVNNFLRREVWMSTKGQYMKESNILAGNVTSNFLGGIV